jgi:hypothetical protein
VVALVEGDLDKATRVPVGPYGLRLVEPWKAGRSPAEGLTRVREIVGERCGLNGGRQQAQSAPHHGMQADRLRQAYSSGSWNESD